MSRSMKRPVRMLLSAMALIALLVPASALAGDGPRDRRGDHSERKAALEALAETDPQAAETIEEMEALRTWTRAQLGLARTHMEAEEYAEAAARIDTVLLLELDPSFETRVKALHEQLAAQRDDDGIFAGKKARRGDRGADRMTRKRLKLYAMSARAHALAGDETMAAQRLDDGIAAATTAGAERVAKKLQKLKDDPSKLLKTRKDRAADPAELESRILEAESKLPLAK